jgi:hypothetical protein
MRWEDEEQGDITNEELVNAITGSIHSYFGGGINNIFHSNIPPSSAHQVEAAIKRYIESESDKYNGHFPQNAYPSTFLDARGHVMEALELYIKKYKISPEKFYGAILLMMT